MTAQILLVEDDPILRTMIKGFLESRGYLVDAVDDGVSGIRLLQQGRYDLALVDYHLPEIDGYMSARLMRDLGGEHGPKLAAITADHQGLVSRAAGDAVFDGILAKPIAPQSLFDFVANMLAQPTENPVGRAASAFLKMPRHELGRQAATAFWRGRGLSGCPKAAVLPQPRLDQIEALSLCFDLCEPRDAEVILVLDASGIDRLASLRSGVPAIFAPAVDAGVDDEESCEAAFRVNDPTSWSQVAALVESFAARKALLPDFVGDPSDLDLRFETYLHLAGHPLRRVQGEAGVVRWHGAGGFPREGIAASVARLETRGLLIRKPTAGDHAHRVEVYELSECERQALVGATRDKTGAAASAIGELRILLAIESPVNRDITASMLKAAGYTVDAVASAEETIAALRTQVHDLLVTDARTKDADAAMLAREIRSLGGPHSRIPMIVLSANAGPAEVAVLQAHGVDAVLGRPFRSEDLYAQVDRLAKRRQKLAEPDLSLVRFEKTVFDGLLEFMEDRNRRYLLHALENQIGVICQSRAESEADRAAFACEAHSMISGAGMLGFDGLSAGCRSYCDALRQGETGDIDEVRKVCAATQAYIALLASEAETPAAAETRITAA